MAINYEGSGDSTNGRREDWVIYDKKTLEYTISIILGNEEMASEAE